MPVGLPPLLPGVSDGCSGIGPEAERKHTQQNERQNRKRRYQNFHDVTSFASSTNSRLPDVEPVRRRVIGRHRLEIVRNSTVARHERGVVSRASRSCVHASQSHVTEREIDGGRADTVLKSGPARNRPGHHEGRNGSRSVSGTKRSQDHAQVRFDRGGGIDLG